MALDDDLINVVQSEQKDLTTLPLRQQGTVPDDAKEIASADRHAWTPIHKPIPGLCISGEFRDKPGGKVLLRLPKQWNGKLVAAGASGFRGEHNGDLVISDFVLQKGYAYVSQNKGMPS